MIMTLFMYPHLPLRGLDDLLCSLLLTTQFALVNLRATLRLSKLRYGHASCECYGPKLLG